MTVMRFETPQGFDQRGIVRLENATTEHHRKIVGHGKILLPHGHRMAIARRLPNM
jgi:hypothetical protein